MAESSIGVESFLPLSPAETFYCHSHSESHSNAKHNRLDQSRLGYAPHLLAHATTSHGVTSVTWSPDSTPIASGSLDETVQVWQAR